MSVLVATLGLVIVFQGVLSHDILAFLQTYFPYVIAGLVVIGLPFGVWKLPQRQLASSRRRLDRKDYLDLENQFRATLIQTAGGIALLVGAFISLQQILNTQKSAQDAQIAQATQAAESATQIRDTETNQATQVAIIERGQITDRFTRAMDLLGNLQVEVRLGGIYALERIAQDSERDNWPVMEVLTAYVREKVPWPADAVTRVDGALPVDVQETLIVLGRRAWTDKEEKAGHHLNLKFTDLRQADLREDGTADLKRASLDDANLQDAHLEGANLQGAVLYYANLAGTHLDGAKLQDAHLEGANLQGAVLDDANLQGAHFNTIWGHQTILAGAHLDGADFSGVDLTQVDGLTEAQIQHVIKDKDTKFPPNLR